MQKKTPTEKRKRDGTTQSSCICSVLEHLSSKFTVFTSFSVPKPLSFEVKNTLKSNHKNQLIFAKFSLSKKTKNHKSEK